MSVCKKIKLETVEYADCSASFCNNIYSETMHSKPNLTYYPFPQDEIMFEKWKEFCQQNDPNSSLSFICSEHFTLDDHYNDEQGYSKLKSNAVPKVIIQKNGIKQNEIQIIDIQKSHDRSQEYDSFYVYEIDETTSEQMRNQENTEEEQNNSKNIDDETEDETEDLDEEIMFDVLDPDQECSDHFESETISDPKIKNKMLYEEARAALKLALSIKPPIPPKRTNEDIFGISVAEQLIKIKNDKIYNDTIWAIQEILQKGIDKIRKRSKIIIEEEYEENTHHNQIEERRDECDDIIEDIIVLDSSEENEQQQNEDSQSNSAIIRSSTKSIEQNIENSIHLDVDNNSENINSSTSKISDTIEKNLRPFKTINRPFQTEINTDTVFTEETPTMLPKSSVLPNVTTTIFSNSAVKEVSTKINSNCIENYIRNKEVTFPLLNNSEKANIFPKVTLQPREIRPITIVNNNSAIPRQSQLQKNQNVHGICQTSNDTENSYSPSSCNLSTLPSNVTVPIILICPPNTSHANNYTSCENVNAFITSAENSQKPTTATSTNSESTQRTTPNFTQDILRAVSNILAATVGNQKL